MKNYKKFQKSAPEKKIMKVIGQEIDPKEIDDTSIA